jgi:hypothetical protein
MSMMFFGMSLKRTFDTIWKSSTKTFQDVMHSTEGTVTGFDLLDSSMQYLGFTAGQALEPIASMLLPIIWSIADLISNNEELFRGIVAALGVGGVVLTAIGAGKLAWDGWSSAMDKIPTSFDALKNKDWSGLKTTMQKSVGIIAIGASIYMMADAIKDFKDGKYMDSALNAAGAVFTGVGGMKMIAGKGGAGLIVIGASLKLIETNTFFKTLFSTLGFIAAFLASAFAMIGAKFEWEMEQSFKRTFKETLITIITDALSGPLGFLIETITGADISGFVNNAFSKGKKQDTFDFDFAKDFKTRYAEMVTWGEGLDSLIEEYKGDLDQSVQNFKDTGDVDRTLSYQININEFNARIDGGQDQLEAFNEMFASLANNVNR